MMTKPNSESFALVNATKAGVMKNGIKVANFVVEYRQSKFRMTLASRREKSTLPTSSSLDAECQLLPVEQSSLSHSSNRKKHKGQPSCDQMQNAEYVFFNEDILTKLKEVLSVKDESYGNEELARLINFRIMIYNKDMLCFNLLIRNNDFLCDAIKGNSANRQYYDDEPFKSSIPNRTKVFDQSIIYLFRETFDLSLQASLKESKEEEISAISDDDEFFITMSDDEEPRKQQLANSVPNLDALPHTRSTFSVSSQTDEDESIHEEEANECSEPFDEGSFLVNSWSEEDVWELEVTAKDYFPEEMLHDEDEANENAAGPRNLSLTNFKLRGSMSTIYSEDSQMDIDDESKNKLREFDLNSNDADDSETDEPNEAEHKAEVISVGSVRSHKSQPKVVDDPYENVESLQAQERSLEEKDLVYTQTIEIVSDDEFELDGRQVKQDQLSVLLDKLPLSDMKGIIKYIREHLLLQKADIKKRQELVTRMEQVLCANGFNCQLYIFGSTKNWLGMRTSSDIDIFIQLKDSRGRPIDESHISYGKIEHVLHRIDHILGDDQSYLNHLSVGGEDVDVTIHTICHRHMRVPITRLKVYLSSSPVQIVPSRPFEIPIQSHITIRNIAPDQVIQVDFNVNNALGIANTRLIRFLCKFEPRFFILNVLLRFWSKYVAMLNKPDALSSYALTNMILFFCQTRKPQVLPPVDYFVKLSNQPKIVNDWRCDFCKDRSRIEFCTQNTETVMQLFVGFFRFYNAFNFLQFKISTRYGRAWRLRNTRNRRQLIARIRAGSGGALSRREADRLPYVHIMDPFEQSHNLTARMRSQMFDKMCLEFNQAAELYRKYL